MYSNNLVTENGDSFIPASQRPDGTWRKARRVKEGYVPQEEVPLYESKGKQFQNRQSKPSEPVRLPSGHKAHSSIPGLFILEDKEKEKKQGKKKKEKKVEEVTKQFESAVKIDEKETKAKATKAEESKNSKHKNETVVQQTTKTDQTSSDPAKRIKNLKKKLREIEVLEEKIKKGEIAKAEPEQLAKIKRKGDLLMELRSMEK